MRNALINTGLVLLGSGMLAQAALAAPNSNTTPEREKAQCRAHYRLCMDVAEIDYNDCMGTFNDFNKCTAEWLEDVSSCLDELNGCLDGAIAMLPPSEQPSFPGTVYDPGLSTPQPSSSPYFYPSTTDRMAR